MATEAKKPGFLQKPDFWTWATLILVALLAAAPLWGTGMVNTRGGGDSPFLLQRTHQLVVNLRAGVFPVRWMPDGAYGLGYPFFSYYAALPYYLAGLFVLVGVDILTALKLVQTLGFVAAALAMYGWMLGLTKNRWAAWLAAVAYTVAPFHLVNVYVRGDSLSEFYAFIFYPLILWGLDGISHIENHISNPNVRRGGSWSWAALAYAGLLLTHNLSALIFTPFVLLYLAFLVWREKYGRYRFLGLGLCALGFGLLLSAWVWLPVLAEKDIIQTGKLTEGYYNYARHFRTANLVQWRLLFDYSVAPGTDTPFAMGLPQAALAALGGLTLVARGLRRRQDPRWGAILLGLLISTAMITPLSKPLWDYLPLLSTVQFPWRFLSVQALFAAAATATLASNTHQVSRNTLVILTAVVLIASTLLSLHPDRLPIGPADVTVERLQLYELFAGNIGTTTGYEYLYQAVVPRPFTSGALVEPGAPPRAIPLEGATVETMLVERKPTRQVWRAWGEGGSIAFPLLYWPGWKAQVDGEPVEVWPVEGSGYLALEVPPGEHTVLLRLGRTPVRAVAETASLVAVIALLIVVALRIGKPANRKSALSGVIHHSPFLILPLLIFLFLPRGDFAGDSDLTMDFIHMPYLHHNPDGVDFDGVARLAGYTLSAEELAPGDTLTVTLNWAEIDQYQEMYTATVSLVSPAAVQHDVEPLAEAISNLQFPISNLQLQLPKDTSRGTYLLQLHLVGPEGELCALTSSGSRQGPLYLRPLRVPRGSLLAPDASVLAPFGPTIRLHATTVSQPAPDRLAVRLAWSTVHPVAANYGISLRLLDAGGQIRVQTDTQPGYGFLPTSLWRPGELIVDSYILSLPDDLPPGDGYCLEVVLYQVSTWRPVGQARLGDLALPLDAQTPFEARRPPRSFSLPPLQHPLGVDFGGEVRLSGYDLEQAADAIHLTLWWQALQAPQADYTVFVHIFDPITEEIVTQSDAQPRGGTYSTSWWVEGEVISETVTLPLEGAPAGTYRLALGLYDHTVTRLPAVGADGQQLPGDRVILPVSVEVSQ